MRQRPTALRFRRFLRSPKGLVVLVLLCLAVAGITKEGIGRTLPVVAGALLATSTLDVGLMYLRRGVVILPDSAVISGLLIALVLSPGQPWYVPIAAGSLAILSRHILRIPAYHLFNPAAISLALCPLLFSTSQDWWGALPNLAAPAILVVLVLGLAVASRVNKLPQVLAFLLAYFALLTLAALVPVTEATRIAGGFRVPFLNATLFFAFFMLTDPPTSPGQVRAQVQFGALVGGVAALALVLNAGLSYLFIGLLAGNAWFAWRRSVTESAPIPAVR